MTATRAPKTTTCADAVFVEAPRPPGRDPWAALFQHYPDVPIYIRHLPDTWGQTIWTADGVAIEIAHDLDWVQQRCTVAHEMHHLVAGKPCKSMCARDEREVREATARWLLPDVTEVGSVLAQCDITETARRLDVTKAVLVDRLASLTEEEETQLCQWLGESHSDVELAAYEPRRYPAAPAACRRMLQQVDG